MMAKKKAITMPLVPPRILPTMTNKAVNVASRMVVLNVFMPRQYPAGRLGAG